jgi:hypothetical protein
MHGATFVGIAHAVIEADSGAFTASDEWPNWGTLLYAGNTTYVVIIAARDLADAHRRCREIGGLWLPGLPPQRKILNVLRYYWKRRPTIRWRTPTDMF